MYYCYYILYIGKPTAPLNVNVVAAAPHAVVVTWTSPVTGSQCIDHYIVTVFNETHNTMTSVNTTNNITSLTIYGLVKGNNYSFTVKGIDHVGQIGNNSQLVYLIFDGKQISPDLQSVEYICYKTSPKWFLQLDVCVSIVEKNYWITLIKKFINVLLTMNS